MESSLSRTRGLLLLLAAWLLAAPASGVVLSDGTFDPADWSSTVLSQAGSALPPTAQQEPAGGNPGAYRLMTHSYGTGAGSLRVFHEYTAEGFDPSVLPPGEKLVISEYAEDHIMISPPFPGATMNAQVALRQDGIIYGRTTTLSYPHTTWTFTTINDLEETDFVEFGGSANPDFSNTGGVIHFGFIYRSSTGVNDNYTLTHGVDNWSVTVDAAESAAFEYTATLEFDWGGGTVVGQVSGAGIAEVGVAPPADVASLRLLPNTVAGTTTFPVTGHSSIVSGRIRAQLGTGTIAPLDASAVTQNELGVSGVMRLCLLFTTCSAFANHPFTMSGTTFPTILGTGQLGVGGVLTVTAGGTGGTGAHWVQSFAGWTPGTVTAQYESAVVTAMGFLHGPLSATSSAATTSGVLQLVSPTRIDYIGFPGLSQGALMSRLTIHLVPEPGIGVSLLCGVAVLCLLGGRRIRR
jgi:hypothetical protein